MTEHNAHDHGGHACDPQDWAVLARRIEVEGEVLLPLLGDAFAQIRILAAARNVGIRRILDIGCGPGVSTIALAQHFPRAEVTAVDQEPEMLSRVTRRAEASGVIDRVSTQQQDITADLARLPQAQLIWGSMVLHHIGDEETVLRSLRSRLDQGGFIALAEFGDPMRFLPDDLGLGFDRPGLGDRFTDASQQWVTAMRADLPDAKVSAGYPAMLEAAGFEVLDDRIIGVNHAAPLADPPRQMVLGQLCGMRKKLADILDATDLATLDVLIDDTNPLGFCQRPDAFLEASRRVLIAAAIT